MKKAFFFIGLVLLGLGGKLYAQKEDPKKIDYNSERTSKDEKKYPGAFIMYKVNKQVTFTHEGIKVWCDRAVFYKKDNFFRASGHVIMKQGDTITMTSDYAEYDGDTQFAFASNDVHLRTPTTNLTTDSLFFDRQKQEAFYRSGGKVRDTSSTITSQIGRYYMNQKKYSFLNNVVVTNPKYIIHSNHIDFYTTSGDAYLYGPSTIDSKTSKIYCERGYYDTHNDNGYFVKNSKVFYDNRELEGDSIYFNRKTDFASATNNIKVTDSANQSVVRGHYAEVYRDKDSVFITKRALLSMKQEQDSIHIHSDTLMVTGKPEHRIIRGFYNTRMYKSTMNGKCDSIYINEDKGITKMLGKPVVFSNLTQMTGDTIELFNDLKTNKLDSISVFYHAFLNQKDTLGGFNQVKGKRMYGLFKNNELHEVHFIKNTETIYYTRKDSGDLVGINKAISSSIKITFENREVRFVEYDEDPQNVTHLPEDFPKNARRLKGFIWRGDERILSKAQLFAEDPPLDLPKIKGIPLPKDKGKFFDERKDLKEPILNDKSRLTPEILQNHEEDTLQVEKATLKVNPKNLSPQQDSLQVEKGSLKINPQKHSPEQDTLHVEKDSIKTGSKKPSPKAEK